MQAGLRNTNIALTALFIITLRHIIADGAVILDPSLYLAPSPPMTPGENDISPADIWAQRTESREKRKTESVASKLYRESSSTTTTESPEFMEKSETFWPIARFTNYRYRTIDIPPVPLSFSLAGTYGSSGNMKISLIGNNYASVYTEEDQPSIYDTDPKSALAGSGYMRYRSSPKTRIYGNDGSASWSGWGNGRWGHYGKG